MLVLQFHTLFFFWDKAAGEALFDVFSPCTHTIRVRSFAYGKDSDKTSHHVSSRQRLHCLT